MQIIEFATPDWIEKRTTSQSVSAEKQLSSSGGFVSPFAVIIVMERTAPASQARRLPSAASTPIPVVKYKSYNDLGQPVCKVCNVTVKRETLWPAHSASRQHKAAVDELRAKAVAQSVPKAPESPNARVVVARPSSALPADFFDTPQPKRPNQGAVIESAKPPGAKKIVGTKSQTGQLARNGVQSANPPTQVVAQESDGRSTEDTAALGKGSLPEGFFDSVDADHRARGLEPPKLDIKDEYREFQKLIKDDMEDVDVRLEEEEAEAAEEREERELLEQRTLQERIERIKERQEERLAAAERERKQQEAKEDESSGDSTDESEEEEEDDSFFVDWRAKAL